MYNERSSIISWHKITLDELICHKPFLTKPRTKEEVCNQQAECDAKLIFKRFEFSFLSPRLVAIPRINNPVFPIICLFLYGEEKEKIYSNLSQTY